MDILEDNTKVLTVSICGEDGYISTNGSYEYPNEIEDAIKNALFELSATLSVLLKSKKANMDLMISVEMIPRSQPKALEGPWPHPCDLSVKYDIEKAALENTNGSISFEEEDKKIFEAITAAIGEDPKKEEKPDSKDHKTDFKSSISINDVENMLKLNDSTKPINYFMEPISGINAAIAKEEDEQFNKILDGLETEIKDKKNEPLKTCEPTLKWDPVKSDWVESSENTNKKPVFDKTPTETYKLLDGAIKDMTILKYYKKSADWYNAVKLPNDDINSYIKATKKVLFPLSDDKISVNGSKEWEKEKANISAIKNELENMYLLEKKPKFGFKPKKTTMGDFPTYNELLKDPKNKNTSTISKHWGPVPDGMIKWDGSLSAIWDNIPVEKTIAKIKKMKKTKKKKI